MQCFDYVFDYLKFAEIIDSFGAVQYVQYFWPFEEIVSDILGKRLAPFYHLHIYD